MHVFVLSQQSWYLQYPGGESESPFVFIVENPSELVVKFPVKGQHKICKQRDKYVYDVDHIKVLNNVLYHFSHSLTTLPVICNYVARGIMHTCRKCMTLST